MPNKQLKRYLSQRVTEQYFIGDSYWTWLACRIEYTDGTEANVTETWTERQTSRGSVRHLIASRVLPAGPAWHIAWINHSDGTEGRGTAIYASAQAAKDVCDQMNRELPRHSHWPVPEQQTATKESEQP